jgi:hypothetical protein
MHQAPSGDTAVYVYCVAPAERFEDGSYRFTSSAIGGRGDEIRAVQCGDLVAIVSDSPLMRYTLRREYLVPHEQVIEEAMRRADVLPATFGSISPSDDHVRERLLKPRSRELHEYLSYINGRVELDVKVYWNEDRLYSEILAENPDILALREAVRVQSDEDSYYDRIQLGELIQAAVAGKREAEAEPLLAALAPLAFDTKINDPLMDTMVLNAAFLVDKQRESEFDGAVAAITSEQEGRLLVQYLGPLPPYNFVSIRVG